MIGTPRQSLAVLSGIGAVGGFAGGLVGLGGGFVVIPLLTSVARFSQHGAHAASLCAVAATSVGASASFASSGKVDLPSALTLTVGAAGCVTAGAALSARLNPVVLRRSLGAFMLVVAPLVPFKERILRAAERAEQPAQSTVARTSLMLALGGLTGLCSGLFGVGGGAIMVPAVALLTDLSHHSVLGTSFVAMALPSFIGSIKHFRLGHITPRLAAPVAAGTLVGSFLGGTATRFVSEEDLRAIFGVLMAVLGVRTMR